MCVISHTFNDVILLKKEYIKNGYEYHYIKILIINYNVHVIIIMFVRHLNND